MPIFFHSRAKNGVIVLCKSFSLGSLEAAKLKTAESNVDSDVKYLHFFLCARFGFSSSWTNPCTPCLPACRENFVRLSSE